MVLAEDVSRYAYRKGLFVLAQSGDAMEIRNEAQFIPTSYCETSVANFESRVPSPESRRRQQMFQVPGWRCPLHVRW
jgi:hypothetical protein